MDIATEQTRNILSQLAAGRTRGRARGRSRKSQESQCAGSPPQQQSQDPSLQHGSDIPRMPGTPPVFKQMPIEEKSIHADKIKEALKNLKDQAEHHAIKIIYFDDDIDNWWDKLQIARRDLKIEGKRAKGVRQYQPKDVIESCQRIQCLERRREDEVIKLQETKDLIGHMTKHRQMYHPTANKSKTYGAFFSCRGDREHDL